MKEKNERFNPSYFLEDILFAGRSFASNKQVFPCY